MTMSNKPPEQGAGQVLRHRGAERFFHWSMAACMLVLLATGFLPVMGVDFAWVDPHWIAGVVLTVLVVFHIVRALFVLSLSTIHASFRDISSSAGSMSRELAGGLRAAKKIDKYSVGQKLFHHGVAVVVLVAIVTGLVMVVGSATAMKPSLAA